MNWQHYRDVKLSVCHGVNWCSENMHFCHLKTLSYYGDGRRRSAAVIQACSLGSAVHQSIIRKWKNTYWVKLLLTFRIPCQSDGERPL